MANEKGRKTSETIFRCPACHHPWRLRTDGAAECPQCSFLAPVIDGVPVLVRDREAVERAIDEAKQSGRANWYQDPQMGQWTGPYRHHLLKRKAYVEKVLSRFKTERSGPLVGLDLGCGDGSNFSWLKDYFDVLYGSDYNLTRLARASRLNGPQGVFMADATDYPAQNAVFDAIYFNHVLEHIPNDAGALSEVARILKPGGLAVLGVPNEGAFFWQLAYRLQPSARAGTDHCHFYTAESIGQKCLRAGFDILEVHPIGWGVPHWSLDARLRASRWVDDWFEILGRALIPSQATSLYLVLTK